MTNAEFREIIRFISGNCAVTPTEEQLEVRLPSLWEQLADLPHEKFRAGAKWLIKQHDFRFFPTVGEMLQAIRAAENESGKIWLGYSPISEDTLREMRDPARQRTAEMVEEWLKSPEQQELLATMQQLREKHSKAQVPPPAIPGRVTDTDSLNTPKQKRGRSRKTQ